MKSGLSSKYKTVSQFKLTLQRILLCQDRILIENHKNCFLENLPCLQHTMRQKKSDCITQSKWQFCEEFVNGFLQENQSPQSKNLTKL